jgi:hypothetical protein
LLPRLTLGQRNPFDHDGDLLRPGPGNMASPRNPFVRHTDDTPNDDDFEAQACMFVRDQQIRMDDSTEQQLLVYHTAYVGGFLFAASKSAEDLAG